MPASAGAIRYGRAFVEMFADNRKLVRGLRAAEKRVTAFGVFVKSSGLALVGVGGALIAPMLGASKAFASMGDNVAKMSKRTGVSVTALSELNFAATQTGSSFETIEMAFRKMQRSIYDAERGLSTQVDALKDLNLEAKDFKGLSPEQQFKLFADRISGVEDPTRRAAIAMTLFGRTGTNLLPMFANGSKGIEELQQRARDLGLTMSTEDTQAAEELTDAIDRMSRSGKMLTYRIGASLAKTLEGTADKITTLGVAGGKWIDKNRGLIVSALKLSGIVLGTGVAITVLGLAIIGVGKAFGLVATAVSLFGSIVGMIPTILAAIVSPIGLVTAAILGGGAALAYFTGYGAKLLTWFGDRWETLKAEVLTTIGAMGDALKAGDLKLAGEILWATLKLQWKKGTHALLSVWVEMKTSFMEVFRDIEVAFVGWLRRARQANETFANWLAKKWTSLQGVFDKTLDVEAAHASIDQQSADERKDIDDQYRRDVIAADRKNADRERAYNDQLRESQAELDKARADWLGAVARARKASEDAAKGKAAPGLPKLPSVPGDGGLEAAKTSIIGTFSAFRLGQLGAGTAGERTAKATEQTAQNTRRINDKLVFA